MIDFEWQLAFTKRPGSSGSGWDGKASTLSDLKQYLDDVQIRECLLRPYAEHKPYPVVMPSELMPSFENELWEYKGLPGFSMVAFDRPLVSFTEPFQYDILATDPLPAGAEGEDGDEALRMARNQQLFTVRIPRKLRPSFQEAFARADDLTALALYPRLMPFLGEMDRAHVLARNSEGMFALAGIFASFPSDFDGELKRYGLQIGKFRIGDNAMYERNRMFVNQYLMELYGFPIASERRTSSALFARRLFRAGEHFIVRVLGQSDRTITTLWSDGSSRHAPFVEKCALVQIPVERTDLFEYIDRLGAFVDRDRRVVLLSVRYSQHAYHPANIRQDRALSVEQQAVVHPLTGEHFKGLDILQDTSTLMFVLNDIVRGEYTGRIVYKRSELIEKTDTPEMQLKALYSWLTKNRRYMISADDAFFNDVVRILDDYMQSLDALSLPPALMKIRRAIEEEGAFMNQARKVHAICNLTAEGMPSAKRRAGLVLEKTLAILTELCSGDVKYSKDLASKMTMAVNRVLNDPYTRRKYLACDESDLSPYGAKVRALHQAVQEKFDQWCESRKPR